MGLFDIKPMKKSKKSKVKIVSFAPKASKRKPSKSIKSIKPFKPVSFVTKPNQPKMKNLIFGYGHPKPARKVTGKLAMTWPQAKKQFPKMNPLGDRDRDGVQNWLDCRPFDKKRQEVFKRMNLNNEKIEPFETVSPIKWKKKTTIPYVDYPEQYSVTKKRVMMTPDEFLELAKQTSYDQKTRDKPLEQYKKEVLHPTNVDRIKEGMKKGRHTEELWVAYQDGRPEGHEGRHRAKAAQELGEKKVPVHLTVKREEVPEEWDDYEPAEEVAQELIDESEGVELRGRPKKIEYNDWESEEETGAQDLLDEVEEEKYEEDKEDKDE